MAQITLTIPDAALPRVVDALCARGGWGAESGVSRAVFAKRELARWLKEITQQHEQQEAIEAALAAVATPEPVDVS